MHALKKARTAKNIFKLFGKTKSVIPLKYIVTVENTNKATPTGNKPLNQG